MGVDFTGDWNKALRVLTTAGDQIKKNTSRAIRRKIVDIERIVLKHVDNQDLGWDKLDTDYEKRKEKKGLSPDTLRASNQMYSNITTLQEDDFTGAVGVRRGVKNEDGEDITEVALIHEQPDNDGKKIPARKLWEPTFNEVKDDVAAELQGVVIKVFKE
ncbi:MAG: hypothetical protein A2X49_15360 [Lentisphaerae bacterium GWF2_52_8]|nr:MAG: hypothetical protein A2X49_15360 [Lentisphaerae bacterium GWF2_52_8]